jgi:hypothetical protein
MVVVAQLVRASDCGSEGRGFESHLPPKKNPKHLLISRLGLFFNKRKSLLRKVSSLFNQDFFVNYPFGREYLQNVKTVLKIGNPDFYQALCCSRQDIL